MVLITRTTYVAYSPRGLLLPVRAPRRLAFVVVVAVVVVFVSVGLGSSVVVVVIVVKVVGCLEPC